MEAVSDDRRQEPARRVVAVVAHGYDAYPSGIVETVRTRLSAAGYGTLCLTHPDHAGIARDADRIHHPLAGSVNVRGSIVLSGIIGRNHPAAALARFAAGLGRGPVVSLGVAVPGVPSVALDTTAALAGLMAHMTRDPRRRRFAFVRGYANGPDTIERENAFRAGLAARNLEIDERLFLEGRFLTADAYAAIDAALANGLRFDGVVAANDAMAASAVMALERHGLSVPDDVIVSGFDDTAVATELQPSLTTVRQRLHDQAIAATELLLGALEGGTPLGPDTRVTLDAELVLRDSSCPRTERAVADLPLLEAARADRSHDAVRRLLVRRLRGVPPSSGVEPIVDTVADALLGALLGRVAGGPTLQALLGRENVVAHDAHWWQNARRQFAHFAEHLPGAAAPPRADAIARTLSRLDGALTAARTRDRLERFKRRQLHERLLLRLAACSTPEAVWTLLREGLHALGVRRAWAVLHDAAEHRGDPADAPARLAFALDVPTPIDADGHHRLADVLPPRLGDELERGVLALVPLHDGEREIGRLLLEPLDGGGLELAALATGLAQALRQGRQLSALARRAAELHRANDALTALARHDPLTGLPNRATFDERLSGALRTARDTNGEVALLFLDLDGFKLVNDTLGHGAGDELLRIVAERVRHVLREPDVLARLGGDEFTIVAPQHAGEEGARRIATDVLATIARPYRLGERVVDVSASLGIAVFPRDGADAGTLIRNADTAMYHAKASGKNRHVFYAPALSSEVAARLELHEDMRRALKGDEFRLHYQPRIELASGRLVGFEALMRWPRADAPPVGPDRFVPVAEECGLIADLDAFALDTACRQGRAWHDAGLAVPIAVNLSVRRLQEDDIVEQVFAALRRHRLPTALLELEITESAAMTDVEGNIGKLGALRAAGIDVAIDDFGTGYSSLSYLKRLPVSSLKIDRSFLGEIGHSADAAIVRAVIALGRNLGFRLVAEGIETDTQLAFLTALGCDEGQGYLFDPALDVPEATRRLETRAAADVQATARPELVRRR